MTTPRHFSWRQLTDWQTRPGRWFLIGVPVVLLLTWYAFSAFTIVRAAKSAEADLLTAKDELLSQNFDASHQKFDSAKQSLKKTRAAAGHFWPFTFVPPTGGQFRVIRGSLQAGVELVDALDHLATVAEGILEPVADGQEVSLASLTVDQKRAILENLAEAEPAIAAVRDQVHAVIGAVSPAQTQQLWGPLQSRIEPLAQKLTQFDEALSVLTPATKLIPALAGYPDGKTYLFLLQNNNELRPSGGFIGTYGILTVRNGDLTSLTTDNVYNLDDPVKNTLDVPPPEPLTKYLGSDKWFFRDSNWSPDFPHAAQQALWFYAREAGSSTAFDGVVAVDTTFIQSFLKLTGNITVQGVTFTPENFSETLQDLVEFGFLRRGIAERDRKEVIGELSKVLVARLLALPHTKFPSLWQVVSRDIAERHLLVYSTDGGTQDLLEDVGWAGRLEPITGDGLALVDANLASLKTDGVLQRAITYTVRPEDGRLLATATVTYRHKGEFTKTTTRYRTYLRLYVPKGSELLSSDGADLRDRSDAAGTVDVFEDLNRTVFAAFKSIEPGTEETITFRYRLPEGVVTADGYTLYLQKQAGTPSLAFTADIKLPEEIRVLTDLDSLERVGDTGVSFDKVIRTDLELAAQF